MIIDKYLFCYQILVVGQKTSTKVKVSSSESITFHNITYELSQGQSIICVNTLFLLLK